MLFSLPTQSRRRLHSPAVLRHFVLCLMSSLLLSPARNTVAEDIWLNLRVVDAADEQPLAARLYLRDAKGTPYYFQGHDPAATTVRYEKQNWINANSVEYHTCISPHSVKAQVPAGSYQLTVERGKEYRPETLTLELTEDANITVSLKRWSNAAARGWFSGDTHLHRSVDELRTIVLAEDLNVSFPLSQWVTQSDRLPAAGDRSAVNDGPNELVIVDPEHVIWPLNTEYEIFSVGNQQHTLGAMFILGHKQSLPLTVPPWRPVIEHVDETEPHAFFDLDKLDWPFAMLLPTITGARTTYELANNHMWRTEFAFRSWNTATPAFIQPPFGASEGGERQWIDYTFGMYYALLNCGLKIPPTAGTANGVHPVPAGFGRVYVHLPEGFSYDAWRSGLIEGRSFVTTGPMLYAQADNHDPGHTFTFPNDSEDFSSQLTTSGQPAARRPVAAIPLTIEAHSEHPLLYAEVLINGSPEILLRPQNMIAEESGALVSKLTAMVEPTRSGWFAIRAWEQLPSGRIRFAHSAPWYVEVNRNPVYAKPAEINYLVDRMEREIERSRTIVSEEALQEYEHALNFYRTRPVDEDPHQLLQQARPLPTNDGERSQWLDNMIIDHRFTANEVREATGMELDDAQRELDSRQQQIAARSATNELRLLPYPGGRHPRRGFLDGAIDPQRDTKLSIFLPWADSGYAVVDLPEAIFSNLGLTYLAHTHIPTIWDQQQLQLDREEWSVSSEGAISGKRQLPNGIRFDSQARIEKATDAEGDSLGDSVVMELSLTNGTDALLTGLRVQVCVMLKGAIGFNAQQNLPHVIREPLVAIRDQYRPRWIITAWTPCQRAWTNPPVPCIHSDPIFPDCPPGETVRVQGRMWFYEGDEIEKKLDELSQRLELHYPPTNP